MSARPKVGKMQPNTCLVYTPNGAKQLGDLQNDDLVCDPYGNISKIEQIFEHYNKPVYKVTFTDGDSTICGLEHLWKVKKNRRSPKYNVMSLDDMLTSGLYDGNRPKWHIQTTEPVYFNKKKLLLDPYIMGLLLGDGSFRNTVALTNTDTEIISTFTQYIESFDGYKIRQSKLTYFPTQGRKGKTNIFREKIRHYNLLNKSSHEKFIPTDYLYSSINDRWELLRGLLDTDGCPTKHAIEYTTVSTQLSIDVKKLVQSLGGLCSIKQRITQCNNKKFESYRLYIRFPNNKLAFKLQRKIDLATIRTKPLTRKIKSS